MDGVTRVQMNEVLSAGYVIDNGNYCPSLDVL